MSIQSHLFLMPRTPVPAKGDMVWVKLDRTRSFWLVKCGGNSVKKTTNNKPAVTCVYASLIDSMQSTEKIVCYVIE